MSNETQEMPGPTKALPEHEWLKKLLGNWTITSEMWMGPDQPNQTATGKETVTMLGDLWAIAEGESYFQDGSTMIYRSGLGYDVTFKQYRGFWLASMSSHLWKYDCELSADGKTLTMNCVGPNMISENETANYRDVIEIISDTQRTLTSYGEGENGEWTQFMKATYTKA